MKAKNKAVFDSLINMLTVDFENLLNLPCYVFWKNTAGVYLGYNDYGALNLGYKSGEELAGKTDHEIFPEANAKIYIDNDKTVFESKKQIFVPEEGVINNNSILFLSYKMPLLDKENHTVGVLGLSFVRSFETNDSLQKNNVSITELAKTCNHSPEKNANDKLRLSEREKECLRFLCKGLTLKVIAQQMKISPKTVETHIERAKVKMNCHNKAQLILAFIKREGIKSC